ncbi:MAG: ABC transporter permease [Firmicutes bacterium]|nr:ABC transporter permease [Bacillota bacterium]
MSTNPSLRVTELSTRNVQLTKYVLRSGILVAFIALLIIFAFTAPYFATFENLRNVLRQVSVNTVVAVGMTFVIILAGIDLSVGAIVALIGSLAAGFLQAGYSLWLVLLLMVAIGAASGAINGYFVAYQGVPAFIVTLATMTIYRGLAFLRTGGYAIPIANDAFLGLGRGYLGPIPTPVVVMVVIIIIGHVILTMTKFGRHALAVGGNEEASRLSGVNVEVTKLLIYTMSGVLAGIAGILLAGRLGAGSANSGTGLELDAIAAVVLGGTDLMGGRGTITGTILGAFIIGIISNGLTLLNVEPFYQMVIKGCIILFAVWFNIYGHRKGAIG